MKNKDEKDKPIKAKFWQAIMYPENMVDDWEQKIEELLQIPFAYCKHDKDKTSKEGEDRKDHVHIMGAWGGPTTEANALRIFNKLTKEGKVAIPNDKIQPCDNVRKCYDYLIHDTDDCRKKKKYLYPEDYRKTGNGFDIGKYEQISQADKDDMAKELCDVIIEQVFCNFSDFYMFVVSNYDNKYFEIVKAYSGLFERLTKGNWQKLKSKE